MAQNDIRIKIDTGNLQKMLQEAKDRFKSLNDVQEKSSQKALIGNQQIVKVLESRMKLQRKITDMEKTGVGLEYKKDDAAQQELSKLNQEVKDYEKNAGKTQKSYEQLKNVAQKCAKAVGTSVAAIAEEMKKGVQEGFSNLLNYSKPFQSGLKGLKASALTLKNAFAAMFAPFLDIAVIAMSYIQKLADYMTQLFDKIGQFIAMVWGQKTYTKAVKQTNNVLKEGKKAGEGYLSPLDKINQLQSSNQDASGSVDMFEEVPVDSNLLEYFDQISAYVQELKDSFAQGFGDGFGDWEYWSESIKTSIGTIKDSLIEVWTDSAVISAVDGYNESVAYMLGSLAGSAASIGLTCATNLLGGISRYLEQNSGRIKEFMVSMFDIGTDINYLIANFSEAFSYIFEAFASEDAQQLTANLIGIFEDSIMGILEIAGNLASDVLNIFIQPFVDNQEEFRTALEGFLSILSEVSETIKQGIDETFDEMSKTYDEHFKPFFDSVASGLSDTVGEFLSFWNGSVQPILDEWADKFDFVWQEHIQPMLNNFVGLLGDVADLFKAIWENILKPWVDWIIENILPVILPVIDVLVNQIFTLFGAISGTVSGIITVIRGIIQFLTGVFTGDWKKAWEGIVSIFNGIFNQISATIESVINGAIDIINGLISGINMISGAIGIEAIPEIEKVSIPRLATGTVVPPNREFLAVLGDNQREPEIVSPVSTMKDAFKEVFAEMGSLGRDDQIVLNVTANVDGRTLFGFTQDYALDYYRRTGRSPYPI